MFGRGAAFGVGGLRPLSAVAGGLRGGRGLPSGSHVAPQPDMGDWGGQIGAALPMALQQLQAQQQAQQLGGSAPPPQYAPMAYPALQPEPLPSAPIWGGLGATLAAAAPLFARGLPSGSHFAPPMPMRPLSQFAYPRRLW